MLKVHSRCDLACDHCYVYEQADQSWRTKPMTIEPEAVSWTALRLAEHAKTHQLRSVRVVLHGGEPLLVGPARLRDICKAITAALCGVCDLDLRIQTNAVQLNRACLDVFADFDVRVGVSLDGDRLANDRHRLFADGRSSHDRVVAAIRLLTQDRYRHLFAGILCTVDVRNDPVAVLDALLALDPPHIDFLLPHATWDAPPLRPDGTETPYARWLLAVHDRWTALGRPVPVRLFDSIVNTLSGGPSQTEALGLEAPDIVVVETDGTFEQTDSLKTAYEGAPFTGMDVFTHRLDDVARHPSMRARGQGTEGLAEQCRGCSVLSSCGGGLFAHRYRDGTGFANPSVYCADLMKLIRTIGERTGAAADRPINGFDRLADGTGDGAAVRELAVERRHITRELLLLAHREGAPDADALFAAAMRLAPDLEPLLSHPYTRSWAVRCAGGTASPDHLVSLVAAFAPASQFPAEVPVRDGFAYLPGRGRLAVAATAPTVRLTEADLAGPRWEPLRRVCTDGLDVILDDLDPFRDCFEVPVHDRLSDADAERLRRVLGRAWALIRRELPAVADAMASGVRVITPLAVSDRGPTAPGGGFAALGVGLDGDPLRAAVDLVRGFRAGVLDALLDQCDLYDETDTDTGALLNDTYARAAADLLLRDPEAARRTRTQWEVLSAASSLTTLGRRFVDGIGRSL
ncbi:FxsB family cyclophane-forming radical SAM/SPASM peptide maturase [Streptomyces sp. TLI_55]|uniref:FxsB family cyclophane-forming radical SAM/SPASM peptide maturase n=1 Tax=Streptomyces sp. TLI_55 TaxID=1938861 RepID=UPI003F8EBAA1